MDPKHGMHLLGVHHQEHICWVHLHQTHLGTLLGVLECNQIDSNRSRHSREDLDSLGTIMWTGPIETSWTNEMR
jgi:hypothetical protein